MKSKILGLVAAASLAVASCSTTYNSTSDNAAYNVTVPETVRHNFAIAYPDATTVVWNSYDANNVPFDWELTEWSPLSTNDYAVTFTMGNTNYQAWYNSNGTLVGTTSMVSNNGLPYAVNTLLRNSYDTYTIDGIQKLERGTQTTYQIKLKGTDDSKLKLVVDANGNILKQKDK